MINGIIYTCSKIDADMVLLLRVVVVMVAEADVVEAELEVTIMATIAVTVDT